MYLQRGSSDPREIIDDGRGDLGADDRVELLARRAADAREAAEGLQQRAAAARTDSGHRVELGAQVTHRARPAVERHREAVRFIANPLHEQEGRVLLAQLDWLEPIAGEEQFLFLGNADSDEIAQTDLLQRLVGGRQLTFAAVDQNQIRERTALLEHLPVASLHDLAHRGEIVGPELGARAADPEFPVLALPHAPVFADNHRRDGLAALNRGDIEAIDAAR